MINLSKQANNMSNNLTYEFTKTRPDNNGANRVSINAVLRTRGMECGGSRDMESLGKTKEE